MQTTEHGGEWCRCVLVSETDTNWDRLIRLVYQQSIDASRSKRLEYDEDSLCFLRSREEKQDHEAEWNHGSCLHDEEEESSESELDSVRDTSSYMDSELEEHHQSAPHSRMPAADEDFGYLYRPPPPPRPPAPVASAHSAGLTLLSDYGQCATRQETETVITEAQITIRWENHGTLHIFEQIPLNRASIVSKALSTVRSGRYDFGGHSSAMLDEPYPSPSQLHATLRRVEMGSDSIHVTGRVENFGSLYTAAARRKPSILPVFVVHVHSDV